MNTDTKDPEYNKVIRIYSALTAALVLSLIPHVLFAALSGALFLGTLAAAYAVRAKAAQDGLAANHMTYIIRTLWISSLFALVTMTIAVVYILSVFDPTPVQRCADTLISGALDYAALQPCLDDFLSVNYQVFVIGTLIGIGPVALYFIYRLAHGLSRAFKGYRIARIKSWF